jgi:exopolysaccharide biosynthesis polyprenyl glycosylphosphotransferase
VLLNRPTSPLVDYSIEIEDAAGAHALSRSPSLEKKRLRVFALMMAMDMAILHFSYAVAGLLYEGVWWHDRALMGAYLITPLFYTLSFYNRAYSAEALSNIRFAARKVVLALLLSAALLNFIAFYMKANAEFSRVTFTLGLFFAIPLLIALRWLVTRYVERHWNGKVHNVLIVQDDGPRFELPHAQRVCARELELAPDPSDPFMYDRVGRLLENQDKVVVTCPLERRADWAHMLKAMGVRGEVVSEPAHTIGALGVTRYSGQDCTTLVVSTGPLGLRSRVVKRGFDWAIAAGALLVLSPLLISVAIAIKLEDGGPVLFVQRRMGRGNRLFNLLKFRSMRQVSTDADGTQCTARNDMRVTRVGRFIRSTSIDELPQLWNVLRGDMSLVGPRPHALGSRADSKLFWEIDRQYWRRHSLRPGLTGLAQVRGHRGNTEREQDLTDRLQSDLEYISGWSLRRDIGIMFQTLSVLRHERAY